VEWRSGGGAGKRVSRGEGMGKTEAYGRIVWSGGELVKRSVGCWRVRGTIKKCVNDKERGSERERKCKVELKRVRSWMGRLRDAG